MWLAGPGPGGARAQHLETVERGARMRDVMQLLAVRGLAGAPFAAAGGDGRGNVVLRRADGSAVARAAVGEGDTVAQLEEAVWAAEVWRHAGRLCHGSCRSNACAALTVPVAAGPPHLPLTRATLLHARARA